MILANGPPPERAGVWLCTFISAGLSSVASVSTLLSFAPRSVVLIFISTLSSVEFMDSGTRYSNKGTASRLRVLLTTINSFLVFTISFPPLPPLI